MHPEARIALLRGINVSGQKVIKMARLKEVLQAAGLEQVHTYIQSGNVVFASSKTPSVLRDEIHQLLLTAYGWDIPTWVDTGENWHAVSQNHPFLHLAPPNLCFVQALDVPPTPEQWSKLPLGSFAPECAHLEHGVIYTVHPAGSAKAELGQSFWEKTFKTPTTARNWNTVQALHQLAEQIH